MAKPRVSAVLLLAFISLIWSAPVVLAQDEFSDRTLDIARDLECPVCSGQSVAESGSALAKDMRVTIERMVRAGESEAEIKQYFVDRYGESVLREPPRSGIFLGLWWIPVAVVGVGALIVALFLKERTAQQAYKPAPVDEEEELEALAREVLGNDLHGPGSGPGRAVQS